MQARSVRRWVSHLGFAAIVVFGLPIASHAQNPFAPTPPAGTPAAATPPAGAPAATPPAAGGNPFAPTPPATTTPAAPGAPAATPPGATPPAAGSNPFAPTTPATTTPAASAMPATPGAPAAGAPNPFAPTTPAPGTTTPAPALPALPGTPAAAPAGPLVPADSVPTQDGIPPGGFRVLAPGVLTTIASPVGVDDTRSEHDLVELLATSPDFGTRPGSQRKPLAKAVRFEHDVWGLDFAFKPIRLIRIPSLDGKERLIWYMVFKVKNGPVKRFAHDITQPNNLRADMVDKPFLFIPRFELESHDVKKMYVDKVIPEAVAAIQKREDKNRKLLTTAEMTGEIPPSTPEIDRSIWGVATWEGVDPRTDRFTIYVHGLTNAYKWVDEPAAYKAGDPIGTGRSYQYQVLKLNFWRPSDTKYEHEEEIRFGIPGDVDYAWFYK